MPGFSTLRWGFCIPQKCTSTDLIKSLSNNLHVPVNIRPKMCQKRFKEAIDLGFGDYITRYDESKNIESIPKVLSSSLTRLFLIQS